MQETALRSRHEALGARLAEFAGWLMPIQYRPGILAEHKHTRENAGLFDICHMGEFRVRGPRAAAALDVAFRQAATEAGLTLAEGPTAAPIVLSYGAVAIGRIRHRECVELSLTLTVSLPGKSPEPHRRSRLVIEESGDDRPRVFAALLRETLLDVLAAPP